MGQCESYFGLWYFLRDGRQISLLILSELELSILLLSALEIIGWHLLHRSDILETTEECEICSKFVIYFFKHYFGQISHWSGASVFNFEQVNPG